MIESKNLNPLIVAGLSPNPWWMERVPTRAKVRSAFVSLQYMGVFLKKFIRSKRKRIGAKSSLFDFWNNLVAGESGRERRRHNRSENQRVDVV